MKKIILGMFMTVGISSFAFAKNDVISVQNSESIKGISKNSEKIVQENKIFLVNINDIENSNGGECSQRTCKIITSDNGDGTTTEYKSCSAWVVVPCPVVTGIK